MPDLSASLTAIRADGYTYRGFLSWITPETVLTGTVSANASEPLTTLSYTTSTGNSANVERDMEVEIFDSGGVSKGRLRVALAGTINSTTLPVNEVSRGRIQIVSGDTLAVCREWRVRDRLIGATKTFPKDSRLEYSASGDAGDNPAPVTCSGGNWAGEVDSGQTYATVVMDGSNSATVDPDSAGAMTHLWTLVTGVAFAPGSASSDVSPTLRVNAGSYVIRHRVTDNTNSVTNDQYVHLRCHDANDPPLSVIMENVDLNIEGDARASFRARGDVDLTTLPDGQMVTYWERERINGSVQSLGNMYSARSHIKFIGFLVRDSIEVRADTNEVMFEAVGVISILEQLPGFSQVLTNTTNATNWTKIKTLTVNRAIVYLLRYGTTAMRVFDFVYDAYNPLYAELFIQKNTPLAQVQELADGVDARFVADRTGNMLVNRRLELETSANRTAATTTLSLTTADKVSLVGAREHRPRVGRLMAYGFTAGTSNNTPLISVSPGNAPNESPSSEEVERLIVSSQTSLNERAGWRYAAQNGTYNGLPLLQDIDIELRGSYDVFDPAYSEWVKLTLAASLNRRGIALSATRCVLKSVALSYNAELGEKTVRLRLMQETIGATGVTRAVQTTATNGLPAFTLPNFDTFIIPATPALAPVIPTIGTSNIGLVHADGTISLTTTFNSTSPTWSTVSISGTISGTILQWCVDGSNPTSGWLITSAAQGIYKVSSISTSPAASQQTNTMTASSYRNIDASFDGQFVIISSNRGASGIYTIASTNGGSSWGSEVAVGGQDLVGATASVPGVLVDQRTGGVAWTCGTDEVAGNLSYLYKTTDSGASWSKQGSTIYDDEGYMAGMVMPYANAARTRLFTGFVDLSFSGGTEAKIYRNTLNSVFTEISPTVSGATYAPDWSKARFTTSMASASTARLMFVGRSTGTTKYGVFFTEDCEAASVTWVQAVAPDTTVNYRRCALLDPSGDGAILYGVSGAIAYWDRVTNTVTDRIGDLASTSEIIGVFGY